MNIMIGMGKETPVFRIEEGEALDFTYENLYMVVDKLADLGPDEKPTVIVEQGLGEKETALANQYKELFEALFAECAKPSFLEAVKQSKQCDERFEELDSQSELSTPEIEN